MVSGVVEGRTGIVALVGTDPAAGVEISETIPAFVMRRLKSVSFELVTDATAVARTVTVLLEDIVNGIFYRVASAQNQFLSSTVRYSAAVGVPETTGQGIVTLPLPGDPLWLTSTPNSFRLRTITVGIQAGDDYGAPVLMFEDLRLTI